jgi:3-(3-hydroxy-phenyl)propionate hydroxylase
VSNGMKPVIVVGAGPVGLTTALGLHFYGLPFQLFEDDAELSRDTKAGTILTRTIEAFRRYGVADAVLAKALRVDEIGDIQRATNTARPSVQTALLSDDTRYPFVINMPQHHLEPILKDAIDACSPKALHLQHRLTSFRQDDEGVVATFETPTGVREVEGSYLLACDGGRSTIRSQLGVPVEGESSDVRYLLVDVKVDLDVANPRDYPYLAYFADPQEWMILVRQPHCWRFLFPLGADRELPSRQELADKARSFIGDAGELEVIGSNVYQVLMGDAAHLITPMWALGLNTGVLDASNLPWRLAWVARGWADPALLDGYESEQSPIAIQGSGEMAQAARAYMSRTGAGVDAMGEGNWGNAFTRALLGVSLDVEGTGAWSMVRSGSEPDAVRAGDRMPDLPVFGPDGIVHLHDLADDRFVALYFTDTRRRPPIPDSGPGLAHFAVSRWDAPHDSALRDRALFDPADRVRRRLGLQHDALVLVRPDAHVAALEAFPAAAATATATTPAALAGERGAQLYEDITGQAPPGA